MQQSEENFAILLVEDEENDAFLMQRAFKKNNITNPFFWVKDGMEALQYLKGEGKYRDRQDFPFPEVIILDLKLPKFSGMDVLAWIRDNAGYRVIPTIVMSSSRLESDIEKAYELGANTYMIKPGNFETLVQMVKLIRDYWLVSTKPTRTKRLGFPPVSNPEDKL